MLKTASVLLILAMVNPFLSLAADTETLILLSGQKIEGHIIEQTPLHVVIDIKGMPETYYLAEIDSINGKKLLAPSAQNKINPPMAPQENIAPPKPIPAHPAPVKADTTAPGLQMMDTTKNVVVTPDGGIIVISAGKMVKYDKNLNIVKKVDLSPAESK